MRRMNKRDEVIAGATLAFEAEGFRGIGVDAILARSGASTRTLYKHFASRDALVLEVLATRHRDFLDLLDPRSPAAEPVAELFDTLKRWLAVHGAQGCMLLRARSEYASANADVVALVRQQKEAFKREVARRVESMLGCADAELATQVWVLFEGATAAASVAGLAVVDAAKRGALTLVDAARGRPR
jgi:AcrR family transcriptional regulator